MKWELLKLEIRNFTDPYTIAKKCERTALENYLNKLYAVFHNIALSNDCDPALMEEFYYVKSELEQIEKHKASGVILRSKCKWAEEGEKSNSYLLRLERHNFCNKLISQIEIEGNKICDPHEILKAQKNYFDELYSDDKHDHSVFETKANNFIKNPNTPKFSDEEQDFCELEITKK